MNVKFWIAYTMFLFYPSGSRRRMRSASKMSQRAKNFTHCAIILAPLFPSQSLARYHRPTFMKALRFADQYDQALTLYNWTSDQALKQMAYSKMILLTKVDCSDDHFHELVHYYGILSKISEIDAQALEHLGLIFRRRNEIGAKANDFLDSLQAVDWPTRNRLHLDMAH